MKRALSAAGLRKAEAPILADFFPGSTPQKLAKKPRICDGAPPGDQHSHFFTATGMFGSLDQNDQQVDDGSYAATGSDLYICDSDVTPCTAGKANGHFRCTISGDHLALDPLITLAQRREALRHPLEFERAGWMVAVAYPGHRWARTDCSRCT